MASEKKVYHFYCGRCGKNTSSPYAKRAIAQLCGKCAPNVDAIPVTVTKAKISGAARKPAKKKKPMPRIRLNFNRPSVKTKASVTPAVQEASAEASTAACPASSVVSAAIVPDAAPQVADVPLAVPLLADVAPAVLSPSEPAPVPFLPVAGPDVAPDDIGTDATALDARIAEAREAMNRLAADLSAKRIELAALREQRRALGPAPRVHRDPDAPRRPTLLDAAAQVLADADAPMQAKAIWRAIVERGLWQTPNGGKTPFATLAAALMRDIAAKGVASRFAKAGRGLFAATSASVYLN